MCIRPADTAGYIVVAETELDL
eukprot:COSAG02_NODE_52598_length_307_cov_0.225962_1_plen_21_part_10